MARSEKAFMRVGTEGKARWLPLSCPYGVVLSASTGDTGRCWSILVVGSEKEEVG